MKMVTQIIPDSVLISQEPKIIQEQDATEKIREYKSENEGESD